MSKTKPDLKQAINEADDAVAVAPKARTVNIVNLMAQVTALDIGQCCSRVERVPMDMSIKDFADQSTEMKNSLRNNMAPSVRGAKAKTGGDYTIEVTTTITTPGQLYIVGIVTRIG
jgi:hypothetical protein